MKTFACTVLWIVTSLRASAAPDWNSNASPETRFMARYHRWVAAIYDRPGTLLSSNGRDYTNFPEFDEIVALGKPALPFIACEIEAHADMTIFLGEAIVRITGWNRADFSAAMLANPSQDPNCLLIERLRAEKLIPPKSS